MAIDESNARGRLQFGGNELMVDSTIDDPPKLRQGAPVGSFGCLSGDRLHPSGSRLEKTLLILKPDEQAGGDGGCYEFFAQRPNTQDDANMIRLLTLNTRGAYFHVPIFQLDGAPVPGPAPPPAPPAPPSPSPGDPTHGIPEGDFAAIYRYYGFASGDEQPYREGRLTWVQVIQRMDQRAA